MSAACGQPSGDVGVERLTAGRNVLLGSGRFPYTASMPEATEVIDLWFGPLHERGAPSDDKVSMWWKKDPQLDANLRERFGGTLEVAVSGGLNWTGGALHVLAEIILLDQFSRNIHRDTAPMYAGDERARSLANMLCATGADEALPWVYRVFVYMPLMHSEELEHQNQCVQCFERLVNDAPDELKGMFRNNLEFSHAHRNIVARFGRFPHRNHVLGRETTPEEFEFLEQPGSSF